MLVGVDVGTSAVKAVAIDAGGRRLGAFEAPHATSRPRAGWVEQDPNTWLASAEAAFASLGGGGADAIGVTGQVNTHVFLDRDLRPVLPAITWRDGRAAAEAAALDARISVAERIAWFGGPMTVDASHALARCAWVAAHEPEAWGRTAHVMVPKDFVIARLTGAVAADPLSSVGLVGADLRYLEDLISLVAGARRRLPDLADPLAVGGGAKVAVVTGTMDAWAGMFGVGVAAEGAAMYLSGTSEVLGLISAGRTGAPGVVVFPQWAGIRLHAAPTQSGGAALVWAGALLGRSLAEMSALTATITIGPASPIFLPHLDGERAPLWDVAARGAFAGLTGRCGPAEIATAVMEGVAFSGRLALEACEASGGMRALVVRAGGGGMRSDAWCQIRADVFARPVHRMAAYDAAAVGAAVMAGVGTGIFPSLPEAAASLVLEDRVFEPKRSAETIADERFGVWRELYAQLRPINSKLPP